MRNIFITGSGGFVGKNLVSYLNKDFLFVKYIRNSAIDIDQEIIIHLAGKAHDLKKVSSFDEYYQVNTEFTKSVFDSYLTSDAKVFITVSSVKAAADELDCELTENHNPNPNTHYGKSKLLAEQYILSKQIPSGKRVYILRPCLIHGTGNKGNLNLLYNIVSKSIPWPLGAFDNKRSFCSIENLCFIIQELIENENIPSGVYNVADDEPLSTKELIELIADSQDKKCRILSIPKFLINALAKFGDFIKIPLNTERLNKLTENYVVSNAKIKHAINKPLPVSSREGLLKTLKSFNDND
jgi:nucleoside-diphosphate-sugar epimerase